MIATIVFIGTQQPTNSTSHNYATVILTSLSFMVKRPEPLLSRKPLGVVLKATVPMYHKKGHKMNLDF